MKGAARPRPESEGRPAWRPDRDKGASPAAHGDE